MSPKVRQLTGLDVYRDGGSLSVSFRSIAPEVEYTLLFPISNGPAFDPTLTNCSFKAPILETYTAGQYVSPVTGVSSPTTTKECTAICWSEARALLEAVRPYLSDFQSEYLWVYEAMRSAAASEGNPC